MAKKVNTRTQIKDFDQMYNSVSGAFFADEKKWLGMNDIEKDREELKINTRQIKRLLFLIYEELKKRD